MMEDLMDPTYVILSNGLCVANHSSPHPFLFDDNSILLACSNERAQALKLNDEDVSSWNDGGWYDVKKKFILNDVVRKSIDELQQDQSVQIILVALPVLLALKDAGLSVGKARAIFIVDRVSKKVSISKFCC
jgi:hypothetical protein